MPPPAVFLVRIFSYFLFPFFFLNLRCKCVAFPISALITIACHSPQEWRKWWKCSCLTELGRFCRWYTWDDSFIKRNPSGCILPSENPLLLNSPLESIHVLPMLLPLFKKFSQHFHSVNVFKIFQCSQWWYTDVLWKYI